MMMFRLQKKHELLRDTYLITGIGLTSNIYLLGKTNLTLIDTGNDSQPNTIINELYRSHLTLNNIKQIIITHAHFDHIGGLLALLRQISPTICVHQKEQSKLSSILRNKHVTTIQNGDVLSTEIGSLQTLHTPGHSPGAICLYDQARRVLYSGDTVFPNGLFGRCDLDGGDTKALIQSLHYLSSLDIDILLPGHEYPIFSQAKQHVELSFRNAKYYFS